MKFDEAIKSFFANYATFSGRARRSEYWFSYLFLVIGYFGATIIDMVIFDLAFDEFGVVYGLFALATFIPWLAVTWRRLHDMGKGGGSFFFILIPLVGVILLIVWLTTDSEPKANAYGPPVK